MGQFLLIKTDDTSDEQTIALSTRMPLLEVGQDIESPGDFVQPEHANPSPGKSADTVDNEYLESQKRRRAEPGKLRIIIENWPSKYRSYLPMHPTHLQIKKQANGQWQAELFWPMESYRWKANWERRHLRHNALGQPLTVKLDSETTVSISVPKRLGVADHSRPQLGHLAELASLSDAEYEKQAPLLARSNGSPFRPTKAQLLKVVQAEAARHKLIHEKSVDMESQIEHIYNGATAELPAKTDPSYNDAVANRGGFERILREFDSAAYWASAPVAAPQYSVFTTSAPVPEAAPDAPTGESPAPNLRG